MKKIVLSIIAVLMLALIAIPAFAFAGSIYKTEPATEAEKAAGKVLEALHERRKANNARGASELYAEKAIYKFHWGSQNELHVKEGRMSIYVALSGATLQGAELSDVTVKVVDDKTVKATGCMLIKIFAFGAKFLKNPEVKWKLCLEDKWQICYEEHSQAPAVRQ